MSISDPLIMQWYQVNNVYSYHATSQNNEILAKAFNGFDDILKYINTKVAVSHESLPTSIKKIIAYMASVLQVAEIAKYAKQPDSRKIGLQKRGVGPLSPMTKNMGQLRDQNIKRLNKAIYFLTHIFLLLKIIKWPPSLYRNPTITEVR